MLIKDLYKLDKNEKIFERTVESGGLTSILMNVCAIGDSLSSGETELLHKDGNRSYYDKYEYSWGQFMARDSGIKVTNLSHGGQTAINLLDEDKNGAGYFTEKYKANAYIIALGVNDLFGLNQEIGEASDMNDDTKNTFAHYYGTIIKKMKELEPNARFFFVTMPKEYTDNEEWKEKKKKHAILLNEFTKIIPHSFVLDLYNEAMEYDKEFKDLYYLNGHLNAAGYLFTARLFESGIDYIIRHNMNEFREFGLMGYPEYNEELSN